jgi:hypothetical protein
MLRSCRRAEPASSACLRKKPLHTDAYIALLVRVLQEHNTDHRNPPYVCGSRLRYWLCPSLLSAHQNGGRLLGLYLLLTMYSIFERHSTQASPCSHLYPRGNFHDHPSPKRLTSAAISAKGVVLSSNPSAPTLSIRSRRLGSTLPVRISTLT